MLDDFEYLIRRYAWLLTRPEVSLLVENNNILDMLSEHELVVAWDMTTGALIDWV